MEQPLVLSPGPKVVLTVGEALEKEQILAPSDFPEFSVSR